MDNYEEIYDQAGFFQDVWEQLPEAFKKPLKPWSGTLTSHSMVIWDCSDKESKIEFKKDDEADTPQDSE